MKDDQSLYKPGRNEVEQAIIWATEVSKSQFQDKVLKLLKDEHSALLVPDITECFINIIQAQGKAELEIYKNFNNFNLNGGTENDKEKR